MLLLGCMITMLSCTPQKEKVSTIDTALQTKVDSILQDKINEINAISGQAIVMEVQTGEISRDEFRTRMARHREASKLHNRK